MTIQDLGQRMTAHELCVVWPLYFDFLHREEERRRRRAEAGLPPE